MRPKNRARHGAPRALFWAFVAIAVASPGCTQIAKLGIDCVPSCVSEKVRMVCDDDGTAREEACAPPTEACKASSCRAGVCSTEYAMGLPCGDDGLGVCREEGACLGENMAISATLKHTCAILHDGVVWCWGDNTYAQLGDGTTTYRDRPVRVRREDGKPLRAVFGKNNTGQPTGTIATGYVHSCAIVEDGSIYCWGGNQAGQSGAAPGSPKAFAGQVIGFDKIRFQSVALGEGHSCALSEAAGNEQSKVYCWGHNDAGQCGVDPKSGGSADAGATKVLVTPGSPIPGLDGALLLGTMKAHNCVLLSNGAMKCWGLNTEAQLAEDPTSFPYDPTPKEITISDPITKQPLHVKTFGFSYRSTFAVVEDGLLYAWGRNSRGQLGTGPVDPAMLSVPKPKQVVSEGEPGLPPSPLNVLDVYRSDGGDECAKVSDATTFHADFACWGGNDYGELALGDTEKATGQDFPFAMPAHDVPPNSTFMTHGEDFGCSLVENDPDFSIWCWGRVQYCGQSLGGHKPSEDLPAQLKPKPVWTPIPSP